MSDSVGKLWLSYLESQFFQCDFRNKNDEIRIVAVRNREIRLSQEPEE